jgi:hypothetical protein
VNSEPAFYANAVGELYLTKDCEAHLVWRPGRRNLADFQQLLETFLQLVRQQGTGKALVDQRELTPFTAEEQAWINTHWLPRARVQGHYMYAAVLLPPNHSTQDAEDAVGSAHHLSPIIRLFWDEAEAHAWLGAQVVIYSQL